MSLKLFPTEYYNSTYSIDFEKYYRLGYRGIIFDIDNTLVPHNAPQDKRSKELLNSLKDMGYNICFVSNNKEPRVKDFNQEIGGTYVFKAGKPSSKGFIKAMNNMGTTRENTLFVGDQRFTDIWGANNAKLHSILVKQISKKEEIQIILKRIIEKPIIALFLIKHPLKTK